MEMDIPVLVVLVDIKVKTHLMAVMAILEHFLKAMPKVALILLDL